MVSRAVSVFDSHINCVVLFHGVILSVVCEESRRAFAVIKGPVDSGVIKESRIDQSYRRIIRLKARLETVS